MITLPKNAPPAFHLLAKPTGAICNLDCQYWLFLAKEQLYPGSKFRMPDDLLETYIQQLLESHQTPDVDVTYAPIRLDGHNLFSIATARTQEDSGRWGLGTLQIRRNRIKNRLKSQLRYLINNGVDPESLQVITTQLNQQMAVQVVLDDKATNPIATVTALDAEIYGLSESELAEEYARQIRQELLQAVQERQPDAQRSQLQGAVIGEAIATLFMALVFGWQRQIVRVRRQLHQEYHNQQELLTQEQTTIGMDEDTTQNVSEQQRQLFNLKRRIDRKTWQKHMLQLLLVVVGVVGLSWILQCFPHTRSLGILLFRQPLELLLIGLKITIAIILSHLFIDWLLIKWVGTEDQLPLAQIERRRRRFLTLSPVCPIL